MQQDPRDDLWLRHVEATGRRSVDFYPNNICQLGSPLDLDLGFQLVKTAPGECSVLDVKPKQAFVRTASEDLEARVELASLKTHAPKFSRYEFPPTTPCLLCTVKGLQTLHDFQTSTITGWWPYPDIFIHVAMKISGLHIKFKRRPGKHCRYRHNHSKSSKRCRRGKGLIEVNTLELRKTLCNVECLVRAVYFDVKNPFCVCHPLTSR